MPAERKGWGYQKKRPKTWDWFKGFEEILDWFEDLFEHEHGHRRKRIVGAVLTAGQPRPQ